MRLRVLITIVLLLLSHVGAKVIKYEAEKTHARGTAHLASDIKGYSGSGFVNLVGANAADAESSIIFSANIPADGEYPVYITYFADKDNSNGYKHTVSALEASEMGWNKHVALIPLRQGVNSVAIRCESASNTVISIDFIEIDGAVPLAARGATMTYFEIEAESASYNGQIIGPNRQLYQLPTEASGRFAVSITQGQYVEFTTTATSNAIVVRYSIPDTSNGSGQVATLGVSVNGVFALNLTCTSIFSWAYGDYPFTKNPSDGKPHHFYDEARGLFGKTVPSGAKVRLTAVNSITYTVDLADFYTAPDPYPMPSSGFISVTDNGADPSGSKDSTLAFNTSIAQAQSQGKGVWIPQGTFLVNTRFTLDKVTVRGAGPWYSTVKATVIHGVGFDGAPAPTGSSNVQLLDFAVLGDTNVRVDTATDSGVGGALNGASLVQNLWIEHTKCGMWFDGPFSNLHITGVTIRNTYADGINLHMGISNVIIEQTILRNVADDALAIWSEKQADVNNTFQFNTIQVPILANGIAFYGGTDNSATDNYVADSICDGGGLQVGTRYNSVPVAGTTTMARTTLVRCGAPSRFGPQDCGSVWFWQEQGNFQGTVLLQDVDSQNSSFSAVTWWSGSFSNSVVISGLTVEGGPYVMEVNSASGTVPCDHVVVTGLTEPYGGIHSCANLQFVDKGGNSGWNMSMSAQHCN